MVKGIDNAFDHMELCVLSYRKNNYFSEKQLALPRNLFQNRFPGSNFLLSTFLTGGKLVVQLTNLLLATVKFEPCIKQNICILYHCALDKAFFF